MYIQLSISNIKREQLNDVCLAAIADFCKALYKYNGTMINSFDSNVVKQVVKNAKRCKCPIAHAAYVDFKMLLSDHLQNNHSKISKNLIDINATKTINNNADLTLNHVMTHL